MSRRLIISGLCACCTAGVLPAQIDSAAAGVARVFPDDEWERYARVMQASGQLAPFPWSLRGFSPVMQSRLGRITGRHAWEATSASIPPAVRVAGPLRYALLPVRLQMILNSSFPHGWNDGAVWAGRGFTAVLDAGLSAALGPLSVAIAPTIFRAQNEAFRMRDNGLVAPYAYGDAFHPEFIDQPQRFGSDSYQRLSPGNSFIRLDYGGAGIGFSTAQQVWGPGIDHTLILGTNAEGFPHVFLESSRPVVVGPLTLQARAFWGRLEQSRYIAYSPRSRLALGFAGVMSVGGLEIGGARFFHVLWTDSVLNSSTLLKPFGSLLKVGRIGAAGNPFGDEPDNQLASLFFRWVFPRGGVEVFGEVAREDHNWNQRDLLLEPDHMSGYMIGLLRTWIRDSTHRRVVRLEAVNSRMTSLQLSRGQSPFYYHSPVRQGHTHLGQVLGSAAGYGGGGGTVAFEEYDPHGRRTWRWSRLMRAQYWPTPTTVPDPARADVIHEFSVAGSRALAGAGTALLYELTAVHEVNRNFGADAFNVRVATGLRYHW